MGLYSESIKNYCNLIMKSSSIEKGLIIYIDISLKKVNTSPRSI